MKQLTWAEMKALEGKRVRVLLDYSEWVTHEGVLLNLNEDGEACVRNDDGSVGYSWPALTMEELNGPPLRGDANPPTA